MHMKKILLAALGLFALLVGAAAWWLHANLDSVVRRGISHYGGQMTQARVSVDAVEIRSTDGVGTIRGLVVGNPSGFRTPHALKVGVIEVALNLHTLPDSVVVIKRIVIDAPDVIYEKGDTLTNFDALMRNITQAVSPSSSSPTSDSESGGGRRLIVDELIIRNARAQASAAALAGRTVSARLPDIVLRDLGRQQGGLTPAQLGQIVARAISQRLVVSLGFDRAVKSLSERVKGLFSRGP
ncbi:MAG TPA: hypothetical protein VGJ65_11105 [Albitalea sp.]|jgi:hypothetical protein